MSFNLGSEQALDDKESNACLTSTSIQLGSEPLFSNLYLIVT